DRSVAHIAADGYDALTVRARRNGDTVRISGCDKKLKRLYIEAKCDGAEKGGIPVMDFEGAVAAVCLGFTGRASHRIADDFRVREDSKKILAIYCVKTES
ncbi:MAG: tRNA lysidine(34) synthetase TilS, partial [Spirochaetota bacterium]